MALSHVPKIGNWESDNVPYTAHFENARRERGVVMLNPNDPCKIQRPSTLLLTLRGVGEVEASFQNLEVKEAMV
ncbi:hypothetical protein HN51_003847 [Arachis hypogaea]